MGARPSSRRFRYSGSSESSLPILLATNAAIMHAMNVEGMQIIMMFASVMP